MKKFENLQIGDLVWAKFFQESKLRAVEIVEKFPSSLRHREIFYMATDDYEDILLWKDIYKRCLSKKEMFAYIMSKK